MNRLQGSAACCKLLASPTSPGAWLFHRHFATWRVHEEPVVRSFCATIRAATRENGRILGDNDIFAQKRRRMDSHMVGFDLDYSQHVPDSSRETPSPSPEPKRQLRTTGLSVTPRSRRLKTGAGSPAERPFAMNETIVRQPRVRSPSTSQSPPPREPSSRLTPRQSGQTLSGPSPLATGEQVQ